MRGGLKRQTQNSYWATGLSAEKGPRGILWDVVSVLRKAVCLPLVEIRLYEASCRNQGGPGWCRQVGKGIGKFRLSRLRTVC